jgi:polysaccharide export outer membrane protein
MLRQGLCAATVIAIASLLAFTQVRGQEYTIGPQDVLLITVWNQPDLSGKFSVDADGTFAFPLVGRIKAGGLTLRELDSELRKQLAEGYFKSPQLSVSIEQYRSQRIFVFGEVRQPGTYPLSGGMTVIEALSRAGSTSANAGTTIVVIRSTAGEIPAGPVRLDLVPDAKIIRVDMRDLERTGFSNNLMLHDGDTVFVPKVATSYVSGEVRNPGNYPVQADTTVLQAVSLAGGATEHGSIARARIIRLTDGVRKTIKAKLDDIVQPGDTIIVPERLF